MHAPFLRQNRIRAGCAEDKNAVPFRELVGFLVCIAFGCHLLQTNPSMVQMAAERMRDMSPEQLQEAVRQVRHSFYERYGHRMLVKVTSTQPN